MNLADLGYLKACELPTAFPLYRSQRRRTRAGSVSVGALRLPPPGALHGRFDLSEEPVAYFADSPETCLYESVARREARQVSLSLLRSRALLGLATTRTLHLADFRPYAGSWPVLISERYGVTRQLAAQARKEGYDGVTYRSAQQFGNDCFALFQGALDAVKLAWKQPLVDMHDNLHRSAYSALIGAQLPLVP